MMFTLTKLSSLAEEHLTVRYRGQTEKFSPDFSRALVKDGVAHWDPDVDGVVLGEARMAVSAEHFGERHLDGDEVLYLISGRMRLKIEWQEGQWEEVELDPGETVIVPQGYWHRIEVEEPVRFLYMGGGRTEVRLRAQERI
jgi:mannose-6-phosphate isomerase-like protein (cupin superfamily)